MLAIVVPRATHAHEAGLSRGQYRVDASVVTAELSLARAEVLAWIPGADADGDGELGEFELLAIDDVLRRALAAGLLVSAGPAPCPATVERVVFVEDDGLRCDLRFTCPAAAPLPAVTLRWPLLASLGPAHRHLAQVQFVEGAHAPEPIDVVVHARRGALTFRRPTLRSAVTPSAVAPPTPGPPAGPPPAPRAPRPWIWIALALLGGAALGLRAWRRPRS